MVSALDVKKLREATGLGLLDCKKALEENDSDIKKSIEWLRKKGLSASDKKSDRTTSQGLVSVVIKGNKASIIELNSETDFVAKNQKFQELVTKLSNIILDHDSKDLADDLGLLIDTKNNVSVKDLISSSIAIIGENISFRRAKIVSISEGVISSYIHNAVNEERNMGAIGVIVALKSESTNHELLKDLGKKIAMHISHARPMAISIEGLDKDIIERERSIFREQSLSSNKPENIVEKMVEGRMRKFYEEYVLLNQKFIMEQDITIQGLLNRAIKDSGSNISIESFVRFQVGEEL